MATSKTAGKSDTVTAMHTGPAMEIRKCHTLEEYRACLELQREVWNFTDAELVPLRLFVVADKIGGQVIGAFDGPAMVGFALSVPGATCWLFGKNIAIVAWVGK